MDLDVADASGDRNCVEDASGHRTQRRLAPPPFSPDPDKGVEHVAGFSSPESHSFPCNEPANQQG